MQCFKVGGCRSLLKGLWTTPFPLNDQWSLTFNQVVLNPNLVVDGQPSLLEEMGCCGNRAQSKGEGIRSLTVLVFSTLRKVSLSNFMSFDQYDPFWMFSCNFASPFLLFS